MRALKFGVSYTAKQSIKTLGHVISSDDLRCTVSAVGGAVEPVELEYGYARER